MATNGLKIAANLTLPADAVTQTFSFLARRGAGKTNGAKVIAERMIEAGNPVVILDPTGVWWGIRSMFPVVILGGDHGDVPLEAKAGRELAGFLIKEKRPTLFDLSKLSESGMVELVADLADEFYRKTDGMPTHWFIDEADEFAPQGGQATGGNIPKCIGAIQRLTRRGRARGIGLTAITQRSAVLNKSVLTQTECLIAMQTTGPQDLAAIEDWLKHQGTKEHRAEIMSALPSFQRGDAIVYSPGWLGGMKRITFDMARSFDSSATPKPGERPRGPKSLESLDIDALRSAIGNAAEEAKANDPRELKAEIARLKKKLAEAPKTEADPAAVARVVAERDRHWQGEILKVEAALSDRNKRLARIEEVAHINADVAGPHITPPPRSAAAAPVRRPAPPKDVTPPSAEDKLGKAERLILRAFYWLRDEEATPAKVAFYSGYAMGSGGFNNALGRLRSSGMLAGWKITPFGEAWIGQVAEPKPSGPELREWLRPKLGKAENAILDALIAAGGEKLTSAQMAEQSGYALGSGGFNNALGRLRSIEAAEGYERDGGTKAADVFFE